MTQQTEARIEQLPSSARAVFSLLGDGKPRTLNEMVGSVSFSPRTIRNALNRLKELTTRKTAVGEVLQSYTYTLGPVGNRIRIHLP